MMRHSTTGKEKDMSNRNLLPMNLQFFSEGEGMQGAGAADGEGQNNNPSNGQQNMTQQAPTFDYEKLASIISGNQSIAEETVLKNYFKQQGLSQEEAAQAMKQFKEQKAKNTPDINALQTELLQSQEAVKQATIEKEATLEALTLGLDGKTIPYVLKLADLSAVVGDDGKVNQEAIKKALNRVLEDVPQLKPSQQQNTGFQLGSQGQQNNNTASEDQLKAAFGL